ncbi:Cytoplasmic FMR1-interacting protein 2 [Thelohanellus kitauei]|uniref:Cytoplasmic FMR1-interacting protein 2 n=1 Tax=Thelohanellus kitauei TaxID=669202 RepID=A0A0C2N0V4_THEKT|nr:Cytoplasmic FMR1-interacting protein 2 [Thelohanellus kitauei]
MISHLLKTHEPNSSEFTLYLAGIYADAADSILHKLKVRHLYDEVVSEANLVFKQLCYHLGLLIYSRRRAETFDHLIDKSSRNHICRKLGAADAKFLSESNMQFQNFQHLSNLCKQLSVQFLGGRINLNAMLCQRLQHSIKESLRHCITYFENQDIHSVILLSSLIDIYQETHVNLSKDFPLPPFETILREVNHDMPGCLPLITHQIIQYLVDDLAQNYSFSMVTERFVRSPEVLSTKPQSTPVSINLMLIYPSKAIMNLFNEQHSLYSQFVGIEHFVEIFKLVGYSGFFAIVDEIKNYISDLLAEPIKNSILTLLNTMPSSGQFPRITDGIRSVMDFFNMSFERVLRSEKMQSEVLHSFRILGNYIVIVYMLEKAVYSCEANDLFISAPLDGFFTVEPDQISLVQKSSSKSDFIKPYAFDQFPPDSIPQNLKDALDKASELNHERMNNCLPIYVSIVDFVSEQMKDAFWKGLCPQLDVVTAGSCELNRVISTIFYYISFYGLKQELSAQYIFGDGIIYGPLFLVVTLGLEDWVDVSDICCHAISASEIDLANKKQAESDYNSKKIAMKKSSFLIDGGDSSCPVRHFFIQYTQTIASMRVLVSKRREILKFFSDKLSRLSPSKPEPLISIPPPTFVPPE